MFKRRPIAIAVVVLGLGFVGARLIRAEDFHQRVREVKKKLTARAIEYASIETTNPQMTTDNQECAVCHMNLEEEEIAAKHLEKGITCAICHGLSFFHRDDENNVTNPDFLYGRGQVTAFCRQCHQRGHKHPERVKEFHEKWLGETRPSGQQMPEKPICTDCHGVHIKPPQ